MERRSTRRALSPLVSTIVLISAAIIGGIIVYNYFQNSVNTIAASSGSLQVSAESLYINSTSKLVHISVVSTYQKPVTIRSVVLVLDNGSTVAVTPQSTTVAPGSKASLVITAPADAKLVYVRYEYNNHKLETNPVSIG
ncbi:MAG: hypothetical protein GSR80_001204 [Desulfurococcales archaeon]|nr:hypothetical protein [Desulfurococcales archaeon]